MRQTRKRRTWVSQTESLNYLKINSEPIDFVTCDVWRKFTESGFYGQLRAITPGMYSGCKSAPPTDKISTIY